MTTSETNVASFLLRNKLPDHVALLTPTGNHTYGELHSASSRVSGHLRCLGCFKGDRVLLLGENSFFWVASYLGTLSAGMVSVPLPADISESDLQFIIAKT